MENKRKELGGRLSINGKIYRIYGGVNQVGRNKDAVVNIKCLGVSQHHALFILVNNDLHYISDLNSSNGTFLNNTKVQPFHLYRLENGCSVRFANIEGIYNMCELHDVDHQDDSTGLLENTQNFTQTFYGSDTQLMDNTFKQPHNPPPDKNYIPSQLLAEVADRLEDSILEIHESPTQVINLEELNEQNGGNNSYILLKGPSNTNSCDTLNYDLHEAETQVIVTNTDEDNPISPERGETRVLGDDVALDYHEAETQQFQVENEIADYSGGREVEFSLETNNENTPLSCNNQVLREKSPEPSTSGLRDPDVLSQEEDVIKPVGLSKNILNDSIDSTSSESDSEVIKPLGKSTNLFKSQDSAVENCDNTESDKCESHDNNESQTGTENSLKPHREIDKNEENLSDLDESQCEIIRSSKKAWNVFVSQESEDNEEESNDSVDFMTMQKIPSTQKYSVPEEDSTDKQSDRDDLKKCEIFEKSSNNQYFGDETQSTDAETDAEDNNSNLTNKVFRKSRNSGFSRDNKLAASICSDSETDFENEITDKNKSVGSILEETMLEGNKKLETTNMNASSFRHSMGHNDLNDSDFIPATQDEQAKSVSQNSKFDNSENSFKLGLTQLMEESLTSQTNDQMQGGNSTEKEEFQNKSQTSQESQKKFTFKKSVVGATKTIDITLNLNEDTHRAENGSLLEEIDTSIQGIKGNAEKIDNSIDKEGFLRPTQEPPKKKKINEDVAPEDEIYILPTQKFHNTTGGNNSEDIYQQSTQKFIESDGTDVKCSKLSENEFYQLSTQKIPENDDDFDIFATQAMNVEESPTKCLESELENMFATQRVLQTDDSLDKIQDIVTEKGIINDKLPREDKDLEAILCTQRMLDSPKTPKKTQDEEKSVESQLEVIFSSQASNLPPDKFVRPQNPLVNILGVESQNTEELFKKEKNSFNESKKGIEDLSSATSNQKIDTFDKNEIKDSDISKTKQKSLVGLEQSFALLEAGSSKIRRSKRKKDCEEVSVSCPKTRAPVVVAPGDKELKPLTNSRSSRKRQPPVTLGNYVTDTKEPRRSKRRRCSEASNTSDEDNEPDISSKSITRKDKSEILCKIPEDEETTEAPKLRRIQKKKEKDEVHNEENKPNSSSKENTKNKLTSKIQDDEVVDSAKRPETPSTKRSLRIQKKNVQVEVTDKLNEENKLRNSSRENFENQLLNSMGDDEDIDPNKKSQTPIEKRNTKTQKKREQNEENDKCDNEKESKTLSKENIRNKLRNKITEDEGQKATERPETPTRKRSSRMLKKENEQHKQISEHGDSNDNNTRNKAKTKTSELSNSKKNVTIEHRIYETKDSDEVSTDSGIEGSDKKKEEPKTSISISSKRNKNKYCPVEIEAKEESLGNASHMKETFQKSRRNRGETKEAQSVNEEVKSNIMDQSKEDFENSNSHSRISKRGCAIQVTTPSKIRKFAEVTPSTSSKRLEMQDTPTRSKRKLKPKVVFTMLDNPQLESQIKQLGGSIVDTVDASTVLLTKFVKRSMKLLSAVGLSKPICSEEWVKQSRKENNFLDPWDYILVDKEAEMKWDFSLRTSLERSSKAKLFEGYTFQLLVTNALDVLKGAIESCGGKTVTRRPKEAANFFVVASSDQKDKYKKILKQHSDVVVIEPEAIFDGVLRQEIRFERHLLK